MLRMTDEDDTLLDELRGVFTGADPVPAAVSGAARALHVWQDEVCGHAMLRRDARARHAANPEGPGVDADGAGRREGCSPRQGGVESGLSRSSSFQRAGIRRLRITPRGAQMPQYMLLIYSPVDSGPSPEERQAEMPKWISYTQELQESGAMKAGDALMPVDTATTVRVRDGETLDHRRPVRRDQGGARRLLPRRRRRPRRRARLGGEDPERRLRLDRGAPGRRVRRRRHAAG